MSPNTFILLSILTMFTLGAVFGSLLTHLVVWFFIRKESYKEARHFSLLGQLKIAILFCYLANFVLYAYLTQGFDRWLEAILVLLLALMAWSNFKNARRLAPR